MDNNLLMWEKANWNDPILSENLQRRIDDDKKWLEIYSKENN